MVAAFSIPPTGSFFIIPMYNLIFFILNLEKNTLHLLSLRKTNFAMKNIRLFAILLTAFFSTSSFCNGETNAEPLDGYKIHDNISEIKKSFIPPSFNGDSRALLDIINEKMKRAARKCVATSNVKPVGISLMEIIIDTDGKIKNSKIVETTLPIYDDLTETYMRQIPVLNPGTVDGVKVCTKITVRTDWSYGFYDVEFTPIAQ